jgi:hypothetical protein
MKQLIFILILFSVLNCRTIVIEDKYYLNENTSNNKVIKFEHISLLFGTFPIKKIDLTEYNCNENKLNTITFFKSIYSLWVSYLTLFFVEIKTIEVSCSE